jgi:hypothetical protein
MNVKNKNTQIVVLNTHCYAHVLSLSLTRARSINRQLVAFCPRSRFVCSAALDCTVRVHCVETGARVYQARVLATGSSAVQSSLSVSQSVSQSVRDARVLILYQRNRKQ